MLRKITLGKNVFYGKLDDFSKGKEDLKVDGLLCHAMPCQGRVDKEEKKGLCRVCKCSAQCSAQQ